MEVEGVRRGGVTPVAGVRKGEGVESSLIARSGGGGQLRERMRVDGDRERVLREAGR